MRKMYCIVSIIPNLSYLGIHGKNHSYALFQAQCMNELFSNSVSDHPNYEQSFLLFLSDIFSFIGKGHPLKNLRLEVCHSVDRLLNGT